MEEAGGAYSGVHEVRYHNDNLYLVVQIQRVRYEDADDASNTTRYRLITESAGAVLYRVNLTGTATLAVIEKYNFSHLACRSLTVFDGDVYFLEHPAEAYLFRPIHSGLDSYHPNLGYNLLPENTGGLKKTNSINDRVETIGALWYEDAPSFGVMTACLVINESLNMVVGYSRIDELLRTNSLASQPDNMQWLVYGRKLEYVLPEIPADGSIFDVLSDIALKTGTHFSMRQNLIQLTETEPYRAEVNGAIGTTLQFDNANRDFPSAGYLLINKEILQYTGITANAFTGLTRGVLGSEVETHADDSKILYLDNIINATSLNNPYRDIRIRLDTNRFYNVVRDSAGISEQRDDKSIDTFNERVYDLDLGLTRHEAPWIDFRGIRYLENLKEIRYLVSVQLKPSNYIKIADVISFYYDGNLLIPVRITDIDYSADSTQIIGRSL